MKFWIEKIPGFIYEANYEKYYQPTVLFSNTPDTDGLTGWTQSGGWSNTSSDAYSNFWFAESNTSNELLTMSGLFLSNMNVWQLSGFVAGSDVRPNLSSTFKHKVISPDEPPPSYLE